VRGQLDVGKQDVGRVPGGNDGRRGGMLLGQAQARRPHRYLLQTTYVFQTLTNGPSVKTPPIQTHKAQALLMSPLDQPTSLQ
jgi:hypothetical protein